jgi:arabinofuranosyltransferase
MSGRFLSVPLIIATVLLLEIRLSTNSLYYGAIAIVAALGLMMPRSPLVSPLDYGRGITKPEILYKGIADHRAENYPFTGVMAQRKEDAGSRHASKEWTYSARQVAYTVRGPAGQQVYQWGPNVHVVDRNGLVDALIARIPHTESRRPGHFWRVIPEGYLESLESGENLIADPDLAVYYEHLSLVIHGPVFSRDRLQEIWRFNTGYYDEYMIGYVTRLEGEAK